MVKTKTNYIFVVGGVMSSVGKGVATASIGTILQSRGFSVSLIKCDMYVNIDAGTMRPTEHGEVFVGDDGIEADQDLGTYERFTNQVSTRAHYITTGQVYAEVIRKERNLEYGGEDVEVVPDIPNEIIRRIEVVRKKDKSDFVIIEIGGTVGEYQNILFLEAARMLKLKKPNDVLFALVSYLPIPKKVGEMKSKPTQYAARTLNSAGIQPDFIICRSEKSLDEKRRDKIAIFCNVSKDAAISAPDVDSVYEVPLNFMKEGLDKKILDKLDITQKKKDLADWRRWLNKQKRLKKSIKIGIVGKYFGTGDFELADSYISVIESLKFACWHNGVKPELTWLDAEKYEKDRQSLKEFSNFDGILVPGGFGSRGTEGKIRTAEYARKNKIPYFGLCLGLQIMTIEYARHVAKIKNATSEEFKENAKDAVIHIMPEQKKKMAEKDYGASMRLGAYPCKLVPGTKTFEAYKKHGWVKEKGSALISERHRHRFEINNKYRDKLEKAGLKMAGIYPKKDLVEIAEIENHPFMLGTQFHPEFKSRPLEPHPLFDAFIAATIKRSK